ncbi:immediate early response gene 2 protein [Haliaeetus albicilla]|uniref:immediate early response gene 2 protein n=1 Tax=Haliaeetus albicilla TaxID=8969 RepID=UPI0037E72D5B
MEEAQRLLTVSVWKLYRCRLQRGGLRLHRSLQLSLLVRAARHRYLTARAAAQPGPVAGPPPGTAPGDPPAPDRGDPPNPAAPDPRSAPDPVNRDRPQDAPSRYRDPPSAPRLPSTRDPPSVPPAAPQPEPRPPGAPRIPGATPAARAGRKRRSSGSAGPVPVPVPSKRARLEAEEPPLPPGPPGRCSGPPAAAFVLLVRAVGAC